MELTNGEDAVVVQPGYSVDKPWFVYDKKKAFTNVMSMVQSRRMLQ